MKDTLGHRLFTIVTLLVAGAGFFVGFLSIGDQWKGAVIILIFATLLAARGLMWAITGKHVMIKVENYIKTKSP